MAKCLGVVVGIAAVMVCGVALGEETRIVTFTKDVAPILYKNCVVCRRPGEVAPMALRTYEEVRPWARAIQRQVLDRAMPPWHADAAYGHFQNDRRLSDADIATIDQWVNHGMKRGEVSDQPPVPEFVDGWVLGEPDHIVKLAPQEIPEDGNDMFINSAAKFDLDQDRWLRAIEIKPSEKRAVHHVFAYVSDDGKEVGGKVGSYSVAGGPNVFPEGAGRFVKKDQSIMTSMHYHPFGQAATDETEIGLYYAEGPITKESISLSVVNNTFKIPAGAKDYEVTAEYTFDRDGHITTLGPHMHARGKDMSISALFPDGRKEMLLLSHWNPDWNIKYELAQPLAVPKGTKLQLIAHFDNSADNPLNPDPTKDLTFGTDEMMIGFIDYLVDAPKTE